MPVDISQFAPPAKTEPVDIGQFAPPDVDISQFAPPAEKTAHDKTTASAAVLGIDTPGVREALHECGREDLIGNGPRCLVPAGHSPQRTQRNRRTIEN